MKPLGGEKLLDLIGDCKDKLIVDCTYGSGLHSNLLLSETNLKKLYCIDYDIKVFEKYNNNVLNENLEVLHMNFSDLNIFCKERDIKFDVGIVDLGVDISQISNLNYGLSYSKNCKLNMQVDNTPYFKNETAIKILNKYEEDKLTKIFFYLGQEKKARYIVKRLINYRKINRIEYSGQLISFLNKINIYNVKVYMRLFQGLRIYINNELHNIVRFLNNIQKCFKDDFKIVFFTFHSVEDLIIKNFIKGKPLNYGCERLFSHFKIGYRNISSLTFKKTAKYTIKNDDYKSRMTKLSFLIRYVEK